MRVFDDHEKVAQRKHEGIEVQVQTEAGTSLKAVTFISLIKEGDFIPSAEYLKVIVDGARLHGFSKDHVNRISSFGSAHQE